MRRTITELLMLLREGGNISIDSTEYSVMDIRKLLNALSNSKGKLELRNCDRFHTSELLMLVRYGKDNLKMIF